MAARVAAQAPVGKDVIELALPCFARENCCQVRHGSSSSIVPSDAALFHRRIIVRSMPLILLTNDDGYRSDGLAALASALSPLGEVTIVAPVEEASAIGHALTSRRALRLDKISDRVYGVDGTPTDCVNIAITQVYKQLPDIIVSGINKGWNLGDDVTYSGTVAGALEGALLGVPSLAVSLAASRGEYDFFPSARAAATLAEAILQRPLGVR